MAIVVPSGLPFGVWLHFQHDRQDSVGDMAALFTDPAVTPLDVIDWSLKPQEDDTAKSDRGRRYARVYRAIVEWRQYLNGQGLTHEDRILFTSLEEMGITWPAKEVSAK